MANNGDVKGAFKLGLVGGRLCVCVCVCLCVNGSILAIVLYTLSLHVCVN